VSLDALRGVAALAVVFWHWQNFFYNGTTPGNIERSTLPLYSVFFLFYEKGWMAVDIFFSLSGFIFFWLYSQRVTSREIGVAEFSVLRISRLYPLHLITLVVVALLQWELRSRTGDFFVYSINDAYHFILNLLFVSGWRTSFGDSFNAPVWSVSVEMFLYAAFFALCRLGRPTWGRILILILIGAMLKFFIPIGRGVFSFFLGGATYYVYAGIVSRGNVRRFLRAFAVAAVAGWLLAAIVIRLHPAGAGTTETGSAVFQDRAANLLVTGILMPLTILVLALTETVRKGFGRHLSFLGDISYSSYMLHFPLQLAIFSVLTIAGVSARIYYNPATLIGFFLTLIGLSLLSYRYLERPAQKAIRRRWTISARVWSAQP
jgi:peptidoglycan/LPS O-acetylase OafA/YrhL